MNIDEVFAAIEAEHPEIAEVAHEVDPPYILGLNVMNLRAARGMTQAQLAAAIGVSQPRIAEVEAGDANPRLATLAKIAHALGVSLSELLVDNLNPGRQARREAIMARKGEDAVPIRRRQAK
jgi:transcriptional regulator with XRE-family HTH domain